MFWKKHIHVLVWTFRHLTNRFKTNEIEIVKPYLREDSVCFDVGAHGGAWSVALSRLVPEGYVYGFEALPYYADVLKRTFRLLGVHNATITNVALGETQGEVTLVTKDNSGDRLTGKTHVESRSEAQGGDTTISCTTLDEFWRELGKPDVRFVKCDVEGFELFVLKGGSELIEACSPVFYNELNAEWCERYNYKPADVFTFFAKKGYTAWLFDDKSPEGRIADPESHVNGDILFLPKGEAVNKPIRSESMRIK